MSALSDTVSENLEPAAVDLLGHATGQRGFHDMLVTFASIAISLKRIADRADGVGDSVDLTNMIQHLAWEVGRSFQHGTRTDR